MGQRILIWLKSWNWFWCSLASHWKNDGFWITVNSLSFDYKKLVTARVLAKVKNNYLSGNYLPKFLSSEVWDCITYDGMSPCVPWLSDSPDGILLIVLLMITYTTIMYLPGHLHHLVNMFDQTWTLQHISCHVVDITIEDCSLFCFCSLFLLLIKLCSLPLAYDNITKWSLNQMLLCVIYIGYDYSLSCYFSIRPFYHPHLLLVHLVCFPSSFAAVSFTSDPNWGNVVLLVRPFLFLSTDR